MKGGIVPAVLELMGLKVNRAALLGLTVAKIVSFAFLETSCGIGASNVEM
jgi:hypothetical protein